MNFSDYASYDLVLILSISLEHFSRCIKIKKK